jgi:hypothetical protein
LATVVSLAAIVPLASPLSPAATLRALEEPGTDETEHQGTADHHRWLAAGDVLEIVPHRSRILVPKVIRDLVHLPGERLSKPSYTSLIFGTKIFGGPAQCFGDTADLVSELIFALTEAGARSLPCLLQGVLCLIHNLVLDIPDLLPRSTALSGGALVSLGSVGLRVRHRHRKLLC